MLYVLNRRACSELGASLVEYSLVVTFISIACITGCIALTESINDRMETVVAELGVGTMGGGPAGDFDDD